MTHTWTHRLVIATMTSALALAACKKDEAKSGGAPATPAPAAKPSAPAAPPPAPAAKPSGRAIPNSGGLYVDAPAKWLDNGVGGAAGMHLDAEAGDFQVRETDPAEAAKSLADWKKGTEEMLFQKWISADATPDGFKALYIMDKVVMKGDDMVKEGKTYAFTVRRKIGDKVHDCSGSGATQEIAVEGAELCTKIVSK